MHSEGSRWPKTVLLFGLICGKLPLKKKIFSHTREKLDLRDLLVNEDKMALR